MKVSPASDKAVAIMNSARMLMMDRGYNGFSFRDIATEVGIRSASIHYHYPTKADLVEATAKAYREAFKSATDEITEGTAPDLLRAYGTLFIATLRGQGGLCLGGVLAADVSSLPEQVRAEILRFFTEQHEWITIVLKDGQACGELCNDIDAEVFAKTFVSSLEGSMLVSRGIGQPQDLEAALELLIQFVKV